MEGSAIAKTRELIRRDTTEILCQGGLPANAAAAWTKAWPRVTNAFKRDASAGTNFWRRGSELLTKLPVKPRRTPEQQVAADVILADCRQGRQAVLTRRAGTLYHDLTQKPFGIPRLGERAFGAARFD